jgi:hypothetical protein
MENRQMKRQIKEKQSDEKLKEFEMMKEKYLGIKPTVKPTEESQKPKREHKKPLIPYKEPEKQEEIKQQITEVKQEVVKPEVTVEIKQEVVKAEVKAEVKLPQTIQPPKPKYYIPTLAFIKKHNYF